MRLKASINIFPLLAVAFIGTALFLIAFNRIAIDTDIVSSLPTNDPVIADGIHIFEKNPIKDQMAIISVPMPRTRHNWWPPLKWWKPA